MWHLLTSLTKSNSFQPQPGSRPRRYQPHCKLLEDRCLLSVSLTPSGLPVPLVGSPVVWTATASGRRHNTRLPVQRHTARRYVPDGSRLQQHQ